MALKLVFNILGLTILAFICFKLNDLSTPPIAQVTSSIDIDAPISTVWAAIIDLDGWSKWNRWEVLHGFDSSVTAPQNQSGWLDLAFAGDRRYIPLPTTLDFVDHQHHKLQWSGGAPVFVYAQHSWKVSEISHDVTRVEDVEQFWRLLAWVGAVGRDKTFHEGMLSDLKNYVEDSLLNK